MPDREKIINIISEENFKKINPWNNIRLEENSNDLRAYFPEKIRIDNILKEDNFFKRDLSRNLINERIFSDLFGEFKKNEPITNPLAIEYLTALGQLPDIRSIYAMNALLDSGVWAYLETREKPAISQDREGKGLSGALWLDVAGQGRARELFEEARRMHDLAELTLGPGARPDSRAWSHFDLHVLSLPTDRVSEILEGNKVLIAAVLKSRAVSLRSFDENDAVSASLVIEAINAGDDLRGLAAASNKRKYLEGIVSGKPGDIDLAFDDWTEECRSAISGHEVELYLQNGHKYLRHFPDGLLRLAQWRLSEEAERTRVLAEGTRDERDLDFAVSFSNQQETVREWYSRVSEYGGARPARLYMEKLYKGEDGEIVVRDWHNTLAWTQNIDRLTRAEIKSILTTINNPNDNREFSNFLARYYKDQDPFADKPVVSARELIKRVLAIEAKIDLDSLPSEILEIIDAPGFNLSALRLISEKPEFAELLSGRLDENQPFESSVRVFQVKPISVSVSEGLGSRKQSIKGTASSTKKLYHELKQLLKNKKFDGRKAEVEDLLTDVPEGVEQEVLEILKRFKVDTGPTVVAQVHAKSDPEGWVCGNYTDSCMPFGDYKNDDYMFNPSTQYFTIKYNDRIVAQSVVVDSVNTQTGEDVIILDNIEIANNYRHLHPLIAQAYETFWSDYTDKPVKIGMRFLEMVPPSAKIEDNTYRPKTKLAYSDATGQQIYDLPKMVKEGSSSEALTVVNISERDVDLIVKLESEAYPEALIQGRDMVEEVLGKQRETSDQYGVTSFIYRKGEEVVGYVLAVPEESEVQKGETVLHVCDFAVAPEFRNKGIAPKMIKHIIDLMENAGLAIEAEARGETFGRFLTSERVQRRFRDLGFNITQHEKLQDYLGGEDFSFVRVEKLPQGVPVEEVQLEAVV